MSTRTVQLNDVCERIDYGFTASADFSIKEPRLLRITDIQDGAVDWSRVPGCEIRLEEEGGNRLAVGDIVVARTGATTGKSFLIKHTPRAVFASYLIRLRPSREVLPEYLFEFLQSKIYWAQIGRSVRGAAQGGVNATVLGGLRLSLPGLSEQQRIAQQLEKANRLCRMRRCALELSDNLTAATFLQLFGAGTSFSPLSVEDLLADKPNAIRTGPFGSQLLHSEFTDIGIAVLGIDNAVKNQFEWAERRFITPQKYQQLKRYTVFPGDVIITLMGTCGRCAIVPDDIPTAINTKHLCCITLDQKRCLPVYLQCAFLYHPSVRSQLRVATKGSIMEGLNMGIIRGLRIPVPPLPMQHTFAKLVARHQRLRAGHRESLRQAEHLFQTLLDRAFASAV